MNSFILKIKSFWKKIYSFFDINPHKHWAFLLYLFSVVVILLIVFSLYLLYEIKNEQIFQVKINTETKGIILKEKELRGIIESFDEKAIKEQKIIDSAPAYKDPSI